MKINLQNVLSIVLILVGSNFCASAQNIATGKDGIIEFVSDAPLELIKGRVDNMRGVLDIDKSTFAFSCEMAEFEGFNSPLQKIHFQVNYIETKKFPKATFAGKIIEQINLLEEGTYDVRAKGKLNVHGIEQERIIKGRIEKKAGKYLISCSFDVPLSDHDIRIPKIVNQKIAEKIAVTILVELAI